MNWPEAWVKRLPPSRGKLSAVRLTDEGGGGDAERLRGSRPPPHPSRPSVVPPYPFCPFGTFPPDRGNQPSPRRREGFGSVQIGRKLALCGTFGYIYWELWRSAPVGGRAARVCRPYKAGGHPPLQRSLGKMAGAQCAPLQFEGTALITRTVPLIRPSVRTGAPSPKGRLGRSTDPPVHHNYRRLCTQEKGQVWNLSLKTQRRSEASQKVLLVPFLSRKESRQLGKVLYEIQENLAEISTFLTGRTVAKAGRLW